MSTWRSGEVVISSQHESDSGPLRLTVEAGGDEEGRVELREAEGGSGAAANTILLPVAVVAVFLVVLVLGAIAG